MNDPRYGTLYGIGVGPGDPDLISVKAVKILKRVSVVFAASSSKNRHSQAVNIARPHIPADAQVRMLGFPMTTVRDEVEKAWITNAKTIIEVLNRGEDAAFLTLGDSMTYSTYGYVLPYIQQLAPDIPIETIPGITAYQAAAARLNQPLVEGEQSLLLLSGAHGGDRLRQFNEKPDTVVMMKAYKNVGDIVTALDECNMGKSSTGICKCSLPNEEIVEDIHDLTTRPPGYWTLIIAKRNGIHEKS
ncbi:MAG: precorrin-2 C(20)-methyltransferase [Desulfobacteraceae bacterium]|nr:precorrin-2 C(20)-methyltransferase [Desulfobacteraceae bacterium]